MGGGDGGGGFEGVGWGRDSACGDGDGGGEGEGGEENLRGGMLEFCVGYSLAYDTPDDVRLPYGYGVPEPRLLVSFTGQCGVLTVVANSQGT